MSKFLILFLGFMLWGGTAIAQQDDRFIKSVTVEGGPIWTKHFQDDDENFRENHALAIVKVETNGYGRWGVYYLGPNSVDDTSVGVGYVTPSYDISLFANTELQLSGALGLVTGYQDYPVPLLAAQARWQLFESVDEKWNAGISAAALPYIAENDRTGDNDFGIVATTPFLSVQYKF